ncbi:MAG: protoglobin domain-containing protein [Elainella sp. Prado103]|jgi:hypothetical protein|nr:protoglobin domain-containing protein [Elainella sp. Prado103]
MALSASQMMEKVVQRVNFTTDDQQILKQQADWGLRVAPEMADAFYAYLGKDTEMSTILNASEGRMHRLRETFVQWFHEMFTGIDDWGEAYAERRWKIGLAHVRIGIYPEHVVPAMAAIVQEVGVKLRAEGCSDDLQTALSKICMIDLAFIEQAYIEVSSAAVLRETGWSAGLFKRLVVTGASAM